LEGVGKAGRAWPDLIYKLSRKMLDGCRAGH